MYQFQPLKSQCFFFKLASERSSLEIQTRLNRETEQEYKECQKGGRTGYIIKQNSNYKHYKKEKIIQAGQLTIDKQYNEEVEILRSSSRMSEIDVRQRSKKVSS